VCGSRSATPITRYCSPAPIVMTSPTFQTRTVVSRSREVGAVFEVEADA